jgi:hypothetical protein
MAFFMLQNIIRVKKLIGEREVPVAQRSAWLLYNPFKTTDTLQPSGLIGKVALTYIIHFISYLTHLGLENVFSTPPDHFFCIFTQVLHIYFLHRF